VKVLLADSSTDLLDVTTYALRRFGLLVVTATTGRDVLRRWEQERPDVVVVDLRLPSPNGLEVCRTIRQQCTTPVLLLVEDPTDEDLKQCRLAGANEYLTKPLHPRELAERIEALGSRAGLLPRHLRVAEPVGTLTLGALHLDAERLQARHGSHTARLTKTEFRLLYLLALNAGQVVPSKHLSTYALGFTCWDTCRLRVHISHLRRKLQLSRRGANGIIAVPSEGYRMETETSPTQRMAAGLAEQWSSGAASLGPSPLVARSSSPSRS
jgi:DNA-binding response OmpR family regulator